MQAEVFVDLRKNTLSAAKSNAYSHPTLVVKHFVSWQKKSFKFFSQLRFPRRSLLRTTRESWGFWSLVFLHPHSNQFSYKSGCFLFHCSFFFLPHIGTRKIRQAMRSPNVFKPPGLHGIPPIVLKVFLSELLLYVAFSVSWCLGNTP